MTEQNHIVALRRGLGWTQKQMAEALALSSVGHVSDMESGRTAISLPVALKLEALALAHPHLPPIDAGALCPDVAAARAACPNGCGLVHANRISAPPGGAASCDARENTSAVEQHEKGNGA